MKKFNLLNLILLLLIVGVAHGQNYTFKVLANKGENKFKSGSEWQEVKTGAALQAMDDLVLSKGAYVGLVHKSGKTLELKTAGTYKVKDLESKVGGGTSSVASKYADFVLSKMTAETQKNRLKSTGSVTREITNAQQNVIKVYMPSSGKVFNDEVVIRWDSLYTESKYVVTFKNMFEDTLLELESNDNSITVDLSDARIAKQNVILFSVSSADGGSTSKTFALKKLKQEEAEKINDSLTDLTKEIDKENALNQFILAGFYEENDLLIDAMVSYEKAIAMAPQVDTYKLAYSDFILRNNLEN
ncbi:hypothetical protein LVD15_04510 [Fulvivirga maritima]|uniref:hypothetical protein n=1 Tax=Fulvivirga maritima TaxID=2904247 RepID=UPI001F478FE0|nr:hypothetical protein [Fulvivirga maritima]UII27691.1 hypothetical protein LVD15_04510 [Fulvivirga maritima]